MVLIEKDKINGKIIECYLHNLPFNKKCGNVSVNVVKVEKFYDYDLGNLKTNYKTENATIHFEFDLNNVSVGDIFIITQVILDDVYIIGEKNTDYPIGFIVIDANNNLENAEKLFKLNRKMREDIFNLPIGDLSENNNFQIMLFCKDIYIESCAQYGQIEIIPYKNLDYEGELKYINNFFEYIKSTLDIKLNQDDILESHFRPSAVINIPNIKASNIERAEEISIEKASILINIFSLLRKSHGSIFAIFVNCKNKSAHYLKFLDGEYRGNLITGTLGREYGELIRSYYEVLEKKPSDINIYIQLLNDYIKENNIMMKYYRLWEIIEGYSRKKNISNQVSKDWNGTIIKNKKGKKIQIKEAKQYVFEIFRQNFNNITEKDFLNGLDNIETIQDFLSIWYQRRNCCVHQGGCFKDNVNICDVNKKQYWMCKNNKIKVNSILEDIILNKAEECVFEIINKDLAKLCDAKKIDYIELRQHYDNKKYIKIS